MNLVGKIIIGLTFNQKLYVDDKLITNECTSIFMHRTFLLFTTLSNQLSHFLYLYDTRDKRFTNLIVID